MVISRAQHPQARRSRPLEADLVAKNADNPKFARTMSNNFAVQIPPQRMTAKCPIPTAGPSNTKSHHTRKVGHVDIPWLGSVMLSPA